MPRPRSPKNSVNALTLARSSSCGPMSTPSVSSITTTGRKRPRPPATATSVPAIAAVATIARKEPVSTSKTGDVSTASGTRLTVLMSDAARTPDEGATAIQPDRRVSRHHPVRVTATETTRGHGVRGPALPCWDFEAPPAGFEPATCGLEVRCSIQLSYGGLTGARRSRRVGAARSTARTWLHHRGQPPFPTGDPTVPRSDPARNDEAAWVSGIRDGAAVGRPPHAERPAPRGESRPSACSPSTLLRVRDQSVTPATVFMNSAAEALGLP